jgi:UDP-3-O-[3-hydroxymyristoyl] glucosamine N-acyltransferase
MNLTLSQIADFVGGNIHGGTDVSITGVAKIEEGKPGELSFLSNQKYIKHLYDTGSSAVLVNRDLEVDESNVSTAIIRVDNAYLSFCLILNEYFNPNKELSGIEDGANVNSKNIGKDVYVGSGAYVAATAQIGDGVKIYPNAFIGDQVVIGDGTVIYANASVYHGTKMGSECIIHSGAVIGSDGFGFAPMPDRSYEKIPQIGNVVIGNKVEIGANCSIDRATMGSTKIGNGVKLDNLVQIAHNVEIDDHTVIAAQAGIAGSAFIGKYCVIAGQAGVVGHISLADGTQIGAQSGVNRTIKEPNQQFTDSPHLPVKNAFKSRVVYRNLPELDKRVHELEQKLKKETDG